MRGEPGETHHQIVECKGSPGGVSLSDLVLEAKSVNLMADPE